MNFIIEILLKIPAIMIATTLHEFVRAAASVLLGDKTPVKEKRLTLNPIKHFEPIGFFLLLESYFGWGKPVNTNALYYKNRRRDSLIVAIAPSVGNFVLAAIMAMMISLRLDVFSNIYVATFIRFCYQYNLFLIIFNILPVAPMDGAKVLGVFLSQGAYFQMLQHEKILQLIMLLLVFSGVAFNILSPIYSLLNWAIQSMVSFL